MFFYSFILKINYDILNINYLAIANTFNLTIINKNNKKIKLAVYAFCIKNGGRARVTSLLINYLIKIKLFELFLFTKIEKEENEYKIPQNIPRIIIRDNIIKIIKKKRIDILIYQLSFYDEIKLLNNYTQFKNLYKN